MLLPTKQNALFRDILDGFEIMTEITDGVLAEIYCYLFNPLVEPMVFQDDGLQQAIFALRAIAEMEQLSSLEGIALFFETEDLEIDGWTQQIIDETEEAQTAADNEIEHYPDGEDEPGPLVHAIAVRPTLSKYYVSFDESYHDLFIELYKQLYPELHQFFSRFGFIFVGGVATEDLIQETLLQVWDSGNRKSADRRLVEKDIWHAAKEVWLEAAFHRNKRSITSMDRVPDCRGELSLEVTNFEFRDWFTYLKARANSRTFWVLELRMAGYIPSEIALQMGLDEFMVRKMIVSARGPIRKALTGKFPKNNSGSRWKFYRDSGGQWNWRRLVNGRWVQCTRGFNSRAECIAATRKLGYTGG